MEKMKKMHGKKYVSYLWYVYAKGKYINKLEKRQVLVEKKKMKESSVLAATVVVATVVVSVALVATAVAVVTADVVTVVGVSVVVVTV